MSGRYRVIRVYDTGFEGEVLVEGTLYQGTLSQVLNEQVGPEEYVISVNESRTNSGTAFYTVVIEDLNFRFPTEEAEDSVQLEIFENEGGTIEAEEAD